MAIQALEEWPEPPVRNVNPPEVRRVEALLTTEEDPDVLDRFSSFSRALRVMAYVFKFLRRRKDKAAGASECVSSPLSHDDLRHAKTRLIILTQTRHFSLERSRLDDSKPIDKKSSLLVLNPFLDKNGVLRVNGRLAHATLSYNERHPIIIPEKSRFAVLYLKFLHDLLLHAEVRLMQQMIRQEFYIPRLKPLIKNAFTNVNHAPSTNSKCVRRLWLPCRPNDAPSLRPSPPPVSILLGLFK